MVTGETIDTSIVRKQEQLSQTQRALLLNRSSVDLSPLATNSVDLILTDPPFYNNLAYSELSDFYYQWLKPWLRKHYGLAAARFAPFQDSLFVRRRQGKDYLNYLSGLAAAFEECSRVLRPSGLLAFTFHHREPGAWLALAIALRDGGFRITSLCPVRAEGVSGFHSFEGSLKWDAVICCRLGRMRLRRKPSSVVLAGRVAREEARWTLRIRRNSLPWSEADRAGYAMAVALREGVNSRLRSEDFTEFLLDISRCYPVAGVAPTVPSFGASA